MKLRGKSPENDRGGVWEEGKGVGPHQNALHACMKFPDNERNLWTSLRCLMNRIACGVCLQTLALFLPYLFLFSLGSFEDWKVEPMWWGQGLRVEGKSLEK